MVGVVRFGFWAIIPSSDSTNDSTHSVTEMQPKMKKGPTLAPFLVLELAAYFFCWRD